MTATKGASETGTVAGPTSLTHDPVFLATRLASQGSSDANRALAELDLRVRHYSVLALACSDSHPNQRELSQFLFLDPSQIVSLVDDLEKRKAVTRKADPRDRRSKVIVPTASGRRLYEQARALVSQSTDQSLQSLTAAERDQLVDLLARAAL